MKNPKKYISIIISLLVVSFMITGFISSPKTTMALMPKEPDVEGDLKEGDEGIYACGEYYSGVTQGRFGSMMGAIPCIGGQVKSGSIVHYETSGYDQVEEEAEQANNGRFYNCYIDVSWQCAFNDGTEGSCRQCVPFKGEPYNGECGNARYQCERGRVIENSKKENDTSYTWICAGSIDGEDSPICKEQKIDGKCSAVHYGCEEGEPVDKKDNTETNKYEWVCKSENGGKDDVCEELKIPVNGICSETERYGCLAGTLGGESELMKEYSWVCRGVNGGESADCKEPKASINGICGDANGKLIKQKPKEDSFCQSGNPVGLQKEENGSWSWTCVGEPSWAETDNCQTGFASLAPKLSGCYVGQDQSSCQIEEPFNWLVSGIYNLLSLVTNKSEIALEGGSGQKNLEIGYPFSDIKLKVDGGEVASSRAWAVCGNGLYWDSESGTCLKPEVCPGEPEYKEPETPYWKYEYGECNIADGEDKGTLTVIGTCQNYDEGHCQDSDGTNWLTKTKEKQYDCFLNPPQPSTIDVTLNAKRLDGVDIDEENPSTERSFMVSWKAVVNPSRKFERCEEIEVREPGFSEVKYKIDIDNESSSGEKEQSHPGTPGSLELSLTCHDKNGNKATAKKTVYFDKITGSQIEY